MDWVLLIINILAFLITGEWPERHTITPPQAQVIHVDQNKLVPPPVANNNIQAVLIDPNHLLNTVQQNGIKRQLLEISSLKNGAQIGIFLAQKTSSSEPIEERARKVLIAQKIGSLNKGRGMLFYLDQEEKAFRIEVTKDLEGEFTDGYLGTLGREFIQPALDTKAYYFPLTKLLNNINNTLQTGQKGFSEEAVIKNTQVPKPTGEIKESKHGDEGGGLGILALILGVPAVALGAGVTIMAKR